MAMIKFNLIVIVVPSIGTNEGLLKLRRSLSWTASSSSSTLSTDTFSTRCYSTKVVANNKNSLVDKVALDEESSRVCKRGFVASFNKFKIWFKTINWEELKITCLILSLIYNIFLFLLLVYSLDYFEIANYFSFFSCLWKKNISILFFMVFISHLGRKILPDDYIFCKSLFGYIDICRLLFTDGFTSNVFSFFEDKFKILLKNLGGSPIIKHRWSKVSLSRYIIFIFLFLSIVFIDSYSNNGLNNALYISLGQYYNTKYTYGLIFLIFILFLLIIRLSILGNNLHNLCKMFYSLGIFKFFISGDKIPAVLQENLFTYISNGNWISVKEEKYLYANNKRESLLLPGHLFFFGLGRLLQVLLRILFKTLGLFFFMLLIFALFNLILNYVSSYEFGNNSYSFYEAINNNLNSRSIISLLLNDNLFSNIIVKNQPPLSEIINVSVGNHNLDINSDQVSLIVICLMLVFDLWLCGFVGASFK